MYRMVKRMTNTIRRHFNTIRRHFNTIRRHFNTIRRHFKRKLGRGREPLQVGIHTQNVFVCERMYEYLFLGL
jgi:hypothetical protein